MSALSGQNPGGNNDGRDHEKKLQLSPIIINILSVNNLAGSECLLNKHNVFLSYARGLPSKTQDRNAKQKRKRGPLLR